MTGQRVIKFKAILTTFDPKIIKHSRFFKEESIKEFSTYTDKFVGAQITLNLSSFSFNPTPLK